MTRPRFGKYSRIVVCETCKTQVTHHRPGGKFCSSRCRHEAHWKKKLSKQGQAKSGLAGTERITYDDPRLEVVIYQSILEGYCTYCHQKFGEYAVWRGRQAFRSEQSDHVIPKVLGGKLTVPCCNFCNWIKGSLRFGSLADIQDYCLDRLLEEGHLSTIIVREIKIDRIYKIEDVSTSDVEEFKADKTIPVDDQQDEDDEEDDEYQDEPIPEVSNASRTKIKETFTIDNLPAPRRPATAK